MLSYLCENIAKIKPLINYIESINFNFIKNYLNPGEIFQLKITKGLLNNVNKRFNN